MDSGERRKTDCSKGVQQGDAMGPALFCMPLLLVLKRVREKIELRGVEAFAYLDDVNNRYDGSYSRHYRGFAFHPARAGQHRHRY